MNKKDYVIVRKTFNLKESISKKLDLISGLTGKTLSSIVNEILEKEIDKVLEESKKNNELI